MHYARGNPKIILIFKDYRIKYIDYDIFVHKEKSIL